MVSIHRVGGVSRRSFIIGGSALALSACGRSNIEPESLASAGRGDVRQDFAEALAWVSGPTTFNVAFAPYRLSDKERQDVTASNTMFPTLSRKEPMLHMRVETAGDTFKPDSVRAVELIFWHFDALPTVIREVVSGNPETVMNFANLSGNVKKGGFAIGTVRGQKVVESKTSERPTSFTWNLGFQVSLG